MLHILIKCRKKETFSWNMAKVKAKSRSLRWPCETMLIKGKQINIWLRLLLLLNIGKIKKGWKKSKRGRSCRSSFWSYKCHRLQPPLIVDLLSLILVEVRRLRSYVRGWAYEKRRARAFYRNQSPRRRKRRVHKYRQQKKRRQYYNYNQSPLIKSVLMA